MQTLAFYLPQFHRVKENDLWWGNGYTEWDAVRAAKPLFEGHDQPHKPQNGEYYNLMDKKVMQRQEMLLHKFGIDGMVFYHYYFKNGRKILEKPAENLLKWTDINMPFCFSWANDSWIRSWSNIREGSPWAPAFEGKNENSKDNGLLIEQSYGTKEDWKKHFNYLLPFFADTRYIKVNNRPVFIFYRAEWILCLREMEKYWNELALEAGFPSLYFIVGYGEIRNTDLYDNVLFQEPQHVLKCFYEPSTMKTKKGVKAVIEYNDLWKKILAGRVPTEKSFSLCGVTAYDDTPRRGRDGLVITGSTPYKFGKYMQKLIIKAKYYNCEFIFINAWNEWGEGMYLEPDEKNGEEYLKEYKNAKETAENNLLEKKDNSLYEETYSLQIATIEAREERYRGYWKILDKLLLCKERKIFLANFLISSGYKKIAIYGLGLVGRHVIAEIKSNGVNIDFGIDQNEINLEFGFPVYTLEDKLPDVEMIIVSVIYDYQNILEVLERKTNAKIISIDELLDQILFMENHNES